MRIVHAGVAAELAESAGPRNGAQGEATSTVVVVDDGGTVVSVNPDFERTAGYSRYEILGKPVAELGRGERDPLFFRLIEEAARSRRACTEIVHCRSGAAAGDESAAVHPLCDVLGRVTGCVAIRQPLFPGDAM